MKKVLLFLLMPLSFCLMTGCGERKMSEEEIQRKIDALYEKAMSELERGNLKSSEQYLLDILPLHDLLSEQNPYRLIVYFEGNQRIGFLKYHLQEYQGAVEYLEKAIAVNPEDFEHQIVESVRRQILENWIALASAYDKLGHKQNSDFYLGQAEKQILQLEKAEPEKDDNIYNIFIHYYVERGKISLNRDLYNDALRFFIKTLDYFHKQNEPHQPYLAGTYYYLSLTYEKLRNYDKTIEMAQKAVDISLTEKIFFRRAYLFLMQMYEKDLNYEDALSYSEKCLFKLDETSYNASYYKAVIYDEISRLALKSKQESIVREARKNAEYYRSIASPEASIMPYDLF